MIVTLLVPPVALLVLLRHFVILIVGSLAYTVVYVRTLRLDEKLSREETNLWYLLAHQFVQISFGVGISRFAVVRCATTHNYFSIIIHSNAQRPRYPLTIHDFVQVTLALFVWLKE